MSRKIVSFSRTSYQQSIEGVETSVETKSHDGETQKKKDLVYVLKGYFYPYWKNKAGRKLLKRKPLPRHSPKRLTYLNTIIDGKRLRCLKYELTDLCNFIEVNEKKGIVYRGELMRITYAQIPYIRQNILPLIRVKLRLLWTMI